MKQTFFLISSLAAFLVLTANAGAETIFDNVDTASAANVSPAGSTGLGPDGAVGGIGGPVAFSMPFDGAFTLTVDDCCLVGDVYQVFVDGASLGFTADVPLDGPTLSAGTFSEFLTAGAHTYDINDQILSYIGFTDPYGGGIVPGIFSPAGLEDIGAVGTPEPATLGMLGAGLLSVAFVRRRGQGRK